MAGEYKVLIDGKWCEAEGGERMEVVNPANGRPFASVPKCGPGDVNKSSRGRPGCGSRLGRQAGLRTIEDPAQMVPARQGPS